jgi:thymidylate synthase
MNTAPSLNAAWIELCRVLSAAGQPAVCRGMSTIELLASNSVVDMRQPVISIYARKLSYEFMLAEACWILAGSDKLDYHPAIARNWKKYSDDGVRTAGAYGPPLAAQLPYILNCFDRDISTRQAVVDIWRPSPGESKDLPCTLSLQFLIRNNLLHCVVTMRSSDIWLGYCYDLFNFSAISAFVALSLRERGFNKLGLGCCFFTAGSQHVYDKNKEAVSQVWFKRRAFNYQPLNLDEFRTPEEFHWHLFALSNKSKTPHLFLHELSILDTNVASTGETGSDPKS